MKKVQKFREYLILEGDTPENFMEQCLNNIKRRIDPIFDNEEVKKLKDFKNFNLKLEGDAPMVDKYSPVEYSLKYKFTDEENILYIFTIINKLKDSVPEKPDNDLKESNIKKVHITFIKYKDNDNGDGGDLQIDNQLMERSIEPDSITPDLFIKLKLDLDKGETESDEEDFQIETGEGDNTQAQQPKAQGQPPAQGQKPAQGQMPPEEANNQQPPQSGQ